MSRALRSSIHTVKLNNTLVWWVDKSLLSLSDHFSPLSRISAFHSQFALKTIWCISENACPLRLWASEATTEYGRDMDIDDVETHIGQQLKMLRISNKMSQKALAEKLGITYQQVQKYEMGMNRISVARVWQFCKIFSVTPDFLFENVLNLDDKNAKAGELIPNVVATSQDIKLMLAFKKIENGDERNLIIKMCQAFAQR